MWNFSGQGYWYEYHSSLPGLLRRRASRVSGSFKQNTCTWTYAQVDTYMHNKSGQINKRLSQQAIKHIQTREASRASERASEQLTKQASKTARHQLVRQQENKQHENKKATVQPHSCTAAQPYRRARVSTRGADPCVFVVLFIFFNTHIKHVFSFFFFKK